MSPVNLYEGHLDTMVVKQECRVLVLYTGGQ